MTTALEIVSLLLPRDDREVVLGDLEEQKQPGWFRLVAVIGFFVRQQAEYWKDWRPWLVGGAVIRATLMLLGASVRLSLDFRNLWHGADFRWIVLYQAALIIAWAGTAGFAVGVLSRRTGWVAPLLFTLPCLICLMAFHMPDLSSLSLFLFLPPAIAGAIFGRCRMRMGLALSLALLIAITSLMLLWRGMPVMNWLLLLPALYLAGISLKPNEQTQERHS